jgi:hypothetical protein
MGRITVIWFLRLTQVHMHSHVRKTWFQNNLRPVFFCVSRPRETQKLGSAGWPNPCRPLHVTRSFQMPYSENLTVVTGDTPLPESLGGSKKRICKEKNVADR